MKNVIYGILLSAISTLSFAQQNIVYKCTDSSGLTSYINISTLTKGANCQKTDLADPDKGNNMVIRSEKTDKKLVSMSSSSDSSTVKTDEQKKRDESRAGILTKELQEELNQLTSVQKMLKNIEGSKDSEQISKLKDMQDRHNKNIMALKKELGIKEDINLANKN